MVKEPVSIIIRTLNDRSNLKKIFDILNVQKYITIQERIVVDTSSQDGTSELAQAHGAKVVSITQERFTYPYSLNIGLAQATHEFCVSLVGHAFPFSRTWLADGMRHFENPRIAGVFGPPLALASGSISEKMMYSLGYLKARVRGAHAVTPPEWPGIFGATNCMFRKSLWERHPFNERYAAGGEDGEWADWATREGYQIICDWRFSVRHSHGLSWRGLRQQMAHWRTLGEPRPFSRTELAFRNDLRFSDELEKTTTDQTQSISL